MSSRRRERRNRRKAIDQYERNLDLVQSLYGDVPSEEQTTYRPEYEQTPDFMFLGESELARAQADPEAIAAQRRALANLERIYSQGGFTAAERMQLQQAQLMAAQHERGQREAIQQQMAARGLAGGGTELAGALAAQQGGANAQYGFAADLAAEGQRRALAALQGAGHLGTSMRGQSFDEAATRGEAADQRAQYNLDYRRGVQERNVGRANEGNQYNIGQAWNRFGARQGVAGQEIGVREGIAGIYSEAARKEQERRQRIMQGAMAGAAAVGNTIAGAYGGGGR